MKIPISGKVVVGVELIQEDELIYLVIGGEKENKIDMTTDAYTLVCRSMAAYTERKGGDCDVVFPEGRLMFKKGKEGAE